MLRAQPGGRAGHAGRLRHQEAAAGLGHAGGPLQSHTRQRAQQLKPRAPHRTCTPRPARAQPDGIACGSCPQLQSPTPDSSGPAAAVRSQLLGSQRLCHPFLTHRAPGVHLWGALPGQQGLVQGVRRPAARVLAPRHGRRRSAQVRLRLLIGPVSSPIFHTFCQLPQLACV